MTENTGPLRGLRVLELGHIMAGPVCGVMLADLGADVVKVERVPGGDPTRGFVPPSVDGESAAFMMMNRNKRGIAVDLKTEVGRGIVRRLAERADVLIENYRTGTMDRLGLGYDRLRVANPGLIYCEISGFGRSGPFADVGGFDLIAQGYSGLMSITGEGPGRPPVKCGAPMTDITAGILGAMGVLAALTERHRTGQGQRVDTSLFEAGIVHTYWQSAMTLATGQSPGAMGSAHPLAAPYEAFQTADGWITIGASSEASWNRLPEVLDMPELPDDPRFRTNADRMANRQALADLLAARLATEPTETWIARLEAAGVPAGPVLDVDEMLHHPQTVARGMVTEVQHSTIGAVTTLGCPVKLSATPASARSGAPTYGQHTVEVLREHDYSGRDIEQLIADGVVCIDESSRATS